METNITMILQLAIVLFGAILGVVIKKYLVPYCLTKMDKEQIALLREIVFTLIRAAEQLEENGYFDGLDNVLSAKKDYVLKAALTECKKLGFTFDEQIISDTIEGLIKEAKKDLK